MRFHLSTSLLPFFTTRYILSSSAQICSHNHAHGIAMFSHTAINPPGNGTALPSAASQPQQQAQMAGNNNNDNDTPSSASQKQPLALPAVPSPDTNSPPQQQIDMSNGLGTVKLDHLGPLVVNVDGSLSRIGNWEQMTDIERRNTLRIVGKRNQARLKVLRETGASGEGGKKE